MTRSVVALGTCGRLGECPRGLGRHHDRQPAPASSGRALGVALVGLVPLFVPCPAAAREARRPLPLMVAARAAAARPERVPRRAAASVAFGRPLRPAEPAVARTGHPAAVRAADAETGRVLVEPVQQAGDDVRSWKPRSSQEQRLSGWSKPPGLKPRSAASRRAHSRVRPAYRRSCPRCSRVRARSGRRRGAYRPAQAIGRSTSNVTRCAPVCRARSRPSHWATTRSSAGVTAGGWTS